MNELPKVANLDVWFPKAPMPMTIKGRIKNIMLNFKMINNTAYNS